MAGKVEREGGERECKEEREIKIEGIIESKNIKLGNKGGKK